MMPPARWVGIVHASVNDHRLEGSLMYRAPMWVAVFMAALVLAGISSPVAAQEPSRTLLYSLVPGETIVNDEITIALMADASDVVLVTTTGKGNKGPFFVFRDGARKGPFTSSKEAMAVAYVGRANPPERRRDCAAYSPAPAPAGSGPDVSEDKSGQTLRFKGSALGPHMMIAGHKMTADGTLAYVTAVDNDKAWFESSDGRKVSFGGTPVEITVSPDGKSAAVRVEGRFSMKEMSGFSKLPPEKFAEAAKDLQKKYVYRIDGKVFGPFETIDAMWFPKTSNDLYVRADGKLFRNGVLLPGAPSFAACDFYPSPDGKSFAVVDYESITFSDGRKFASPLNVLAYQNGGKMVYRWIALEKNKDLVVFQRTM
jgi:hypothetical protein